MDAGRTRGPDELVAGAEREEPRSPLPAWVLGLVLAAVVLAVVRPDLSLHADRPDRPDARPSPTQTIGDPPDGRRLDGIRWDPRGDLVADRRFVAAAVSRVRGERPDVSRVLFAGRLPDGSKLVLAASDVNRGVVASRVHALLVPVGAPVAAATVSEATALTDPQQVLAWAAQARDGRVYAVAMSRPGPVRFELSARVRFSAAGSPRRLWTPAYAEDGVVVADLGRQADPIVSVRAEGPGVFALPLVVRVLPLVADSPVLLVSGVAVGAYVGPGALQVSRALRAQAGSVVDLDAAEREVLWSGSPWKQRRLALVLLTRPDGQRFQALVGQQGDIDFPAGVRALPRGAPVRLPWLLEPFTSEDPTLLLCPTGPGSLVYRRAGQPPRTLRVSAAGVAALVPPGPSAPSAGGAEVTLLDEGGRFLLRTTLPDPGFDDPLDLD